MIDTVLQHAVAPVTRMGATPHTGQRENSMRVVSLGSARPARDRLRAALSEREKAMLFDLALAAGAREASCREALAAAPLIEAFARAYVAIRDREDGLI